MTTNEFFVPYIAAQTLKQIGFNEPTKAIFIHGQCMLMESYSYNKLFQNSDICSAPTMQTALKWLREERHIFIEIMANEYLYTYNVKLFTIEKGWTPAMNQENKTFDTYEDAVCDGLITGLKYTYYNGKEN